MKSPSSESSSNRDNLQLSSRKIMQTWAFRWIRIDYCFACRFNGFPVSTCVQNVLAWNQDFLVFSSFIKIFDWAIVYIGWMVIIVSCFCSQPKSCRIKVRWNSEQSNRIRRANTKWRLYLSRRFQALVFILVQSNQAYFSASNIERCSNLNSNSH